MGWQDAPVVGNTPSANAWESAPLARQNVGAESERSVAGFGKNILKSGGEMLGGIYQAVRHPANTVGTLADIAAGAMYKTLTPESVAQINQFFGDKSATEAIDVANAVGGLYKQRYGSLDALTNTLYKDPVGAVGDLSTLLSGGGAAATKVGKLAQVSPIAKVGQAGQVLEQTGDILSTAGKYTNPLLPVEAGVKYAAANPTVQKVGSVLTAPVRGIYNVIEPLTPSGSANVKARGYAEALGNDPAKLDAAIKMLQQGKTIEEVSVALGSTGLASFARDAQDASTVIRDLYNAREASLKASQANRLAGATTNLNALNEQNIPVSNVSPNAPRRAVNQSLSAEAQALENQRNQAVGNVANVSQVNLGEQLAKANEAILENTKKTVTGPAYNAAFEAAPKATIDVSGLATVAKGQLNDLLNQLQNLAPNAAALLQKYGPRKEVVNMGDGLTTTIAAKAKPITLAEAQDIIHAINIDNAALKISTESSANVARKNLAELRTAIQDAIKAGVSPEAYAKLQTANALFKERIVGVHRTGSPANLIRESNLNQPMLVAEDIVPKLLSSEGETRQFLKIFSQDPAAMKNVATGVEDLYRQQVLSPTASKDAHAAFMAKHEKQLATLDEAGMGIRDRLTSIDKELGKVKAGEEALQLASDNLKFKNTNDLRAAVIKDPMVMDMALRRMDAPAKAALARGVLQDAMAGGGAKALENLTKNEQTIMTALKAHDPKTAAKTFADAKQMADIYRLIEETGNKLPATAGAANALTTAKNIEGLTQGLPEVRAAVQKIQQEMQTGVDFEKLAAQGRAAGGGSSKLATEAVGKQPNVFFNKAATIANIIINRLKGKIDNTLAVEIAKELANSSTAAEALIKSQAKRAEVATKSDRATKTLNALTSPGTLAVERANESNQNALAR
jgi:hypothetical protein